MSLTIENVCWWKTPNNPPSEYERSIYLDILAWAYDKNKKLGSRPIKFGTIEQITKEYWAEILEGRDAVGIH